ncbi:hypothetical protein H5410_060450 [Solanum commersonii]|uniref:Uncharacterized protein n=1 Tax=Solanum commersonii TaxID=4109 RepID=A0A9J5W615_SOLCO|nr:hypothetical protein H5410_060450 [Solanum commersonii]
MTLSEVIVRNTTLRNPQGEIPYDTYTYGKLIGVCTQEGINLCNELKLSKQLKIDKLRERSQLGDFCTHSESDYDSESGLEEDIDLHSLLIIINRVEVRGITHTKGEDNPQDKHLQDRHTDPRLTRQFYSEEERA